MIYNTSNQVEESQYPPLKTTKQQYTEKLNEKEKVYKLEKEVASLQYKLSNLLAAESPQTLATANHHETLTPRNDLGVQEYSEFTEKLGLKLDRVMKDLDGLKKQMVTFSIADEKEPCHSASQNSKNSDSKSRAQNNASASPVRIPMQEYIAEEVNRQFELYRDKYLTSFLANSILQIETRLTEKIEERFFSKYQKNNNSSFADTDSSKHESNHPELLSSRLYSMEKEDPLRRIFFASKHEAEKQFLHSQHSSGRSTPKNNTENEGKRVRWEEDQNQRYSAVSEQDSQDSEILLKKLKEKIDQKARLVKAMEVKKDQQQQKKKVVISVPPPSRSFTRPTTASQLKSKAFCLD